MKKVNLNSEDFQKNSKSISNFLSKKAMSKIVGGKIGDIPTSYCDSCYVRH